MKNIEMLEMHHEFQQLAEATCSPRWDVTNEDNWTGGTATAIGRMQWQDAFRVARTAAIEIPWLPKPCPGADPKGFIWVTWEDTARSLKLTLKINPSLEGKRIEWTTRRDGTDANHSADTLRPLIESLRATFPKPAIILA